MSSATFDNWRRVLESLPIVEKTPYDFAVYPLDRTLSHINPSLTHGHQIEIDFASGVI